MNNKLLFLLLYFVLSSLKIGGCEVICVKWVLNTVQTVQVDLNSLESSK
uniref:Uncharacterized protein n=1 Tax=Anguilla anguilla TaxID=7936 RepID=A0A0E9SHR8_ANGAN